MQRYDRQIRVFGAAGQKILQKLTVGIAGLGGIGSLVFILLVRLGVGCIIIIDHDCVEESNLNRLAGSTLEDARKKTLKVHMLKRYAAKINPGIKVIAIPRSIHETKVLNILKLCDVIFGCTDNQGTRWILNQFSVQHLIPYFDTGTGVKADSKQNIEHAGGQVRVVIPGMGCLNCIDGIDVSIAQQELMPEPDRQVAERLGYIEGADVPAPAVASLNGPIANLAVTEFMAFATGFRALKRYVFYDFMNAEVVTLPFDKDPNCIICSKTGSFAAGDEGEPLPAEMLLKEPVLPVKGDSHMETEAITIEQSLQTLLAKAREKDFEIEGSSEGRWFLLKNVKTGKPINKPKTNVMVKFIEDSNDPIILVPESLDIRKQDHICPNFIAINTYIKGWKPLCPDIFDDVGINLFEFLVALTGLISKPSLCGLMGCTKKGLPDQQS